MPFITWSNATAVGLETVDEQHRKLFDILNDLHAATMEGQEQSALRAIFNELIEYTVYHFENEEELHARYGFPDAAEHKREHDKLTAQAVELQRQFEEGSATVSFDLLDFLHGWLMDHTIGMDMAMASHLKGKGAR
ncbi:MAG: bacteriohemerythrin [Desulfovibrionaceae bacterium]